MPQVLTPAIHNSCYRGIVPAIGITLLFYITRDAFAFVVSGRSEDFPLPQLSCYLGRSKPIHNIQPDFIDHIGSLTVGYAHGQCPGSRQQGHNPRPGGVSTRQGLEQLLQTVNKVKRQINPKLQIDGILLTMVDNRTNFAKEIAALLRETYGSKIKVFATEIPHSVRAKEISAEGKSIFAHDPGGKVAESYKNLTQEVTKLEKQREKVELASVDDLFSTEESRADAQREVFPSALTGAFLCR